MSKGMKILDLHIKAKWYDMIESGEKTEEYREIKPYWLKRLFYLCPSFAIYHERIEKLYSSFPYEYIYFVKTYLRTSYLSVKPYTHIRFHYGYTKRTMLMGMEDITIGRGEPKWGAPFDREVFIISFEKNK